MKPVPQPNWIRQITQPFKYYEFSLLRGGEVRTWRCRTRPQAETKRTRAYKDGWGNLPPALM